MLKIIKNYKYIITIIVILLIICLSYIRINILKENNQEYTLKKEPIILLEDVDTTDEKKQETEENKKIKIDIKGQVAFPGVYELEENSRVIDIINLAGGLTEKANTSLINLSKKLEDQMVVIIYSNEEVANSNVKEIETVFKVIEKECNCPNIKNDSCINTELDNSNNDSSSKSNTNEEINGLVNLNTASLEELMSLSGVGESKAEAIIKYRNKNKFNVIEDIMNVSGIGEAVFEKIKEYITV